MSDYVVASRVDWHKDQFDALAAEEAGNWHWVSTPEELNRCLESVQPEYIFFLHWSWIVPASIYQHVECVCFHMTDVPYGRGGSPLQNLIVRGHKNTQLSALKMVKELDAGPVYLKQPLSLEGSAEEIYRRAGQQSFTMLRLIKQQRLVPTPQQGEPVVFERRRPEQSELPTATVESLEQLYDYIRMLDAPGYPHAFATLGEFRMEFNKAELSGNTLYSSVKITKRSENGN